MLEAFEKRIQDVRLRCSVNLLLEQAAMKAGNKAATHRFRAEKLYAEGDTEPAIRQLEIALRQRDIAYHDAARIQARLDAWKEEERDRKRREKGLFGERDQS
jgi:predicted Zn-dependent protease